MKIFPAIYTDRLSLTKLSTVVYVFLVCLLLSVSTNAQKKYAPEALKADLDTLYKQLLDTHPDVAAYQPLDSFELAYKKLKASLTDSLSQRAFYTRLAPFYMSLKDAHGTLSMPLPPFNDMLKAGAFLLPIEVKLLNNELFILDDKDSLIAKGSKLLSINDITSDSIVQTMLKSMPADGDIPTLRTAFFETRFYPYFPVFFEVDSLNKVEVWDAEKETVDTIIYPGQRMKPPKELTRKGRKKRNQSALQFELEEELSLATLKITTFSATLPHFQYRRFLKKAFKTINEKNIQNLVIDIRGNAGGSPDRGIELMEYFSRGEFKLYHQNIVRASPFCKQYLHDLITLPRLTMFFFSKFSNKEVYAAYKIPEGQYDTVYYEVHRKVAKKNHFKGKVFLLVDGLSASASGLLTNAIAEAGLATIVGEETGCTTNGCFGQAAWFTLPNTKLRARISLFRFMSSGRFEYDNRGYMPMHDVPDVLEDLIEGRDTQLEYVRELLK